MDEKVVEVQAAWREGAHVDDAKYLADVRGVGHRPGRVLGRARQAHRLDDAVHQGQEYQLRAGKVSIKWFEDGTTNVAYNCVDRHLETRGDQIAIIWEGDDPDESKHITYRELHAQVCRMANVLRNRGVGKGDRVTIYMPMIPEAAYAMLACARLGAIHSIVFGGFSPDSPGPPHRGLRPRRW